MLERRKHRSTGSWWQTHEVPVMDGLSSTLGFMTRRGPRTEVRFKMDRVDYWLGQGVEPSDTVAFLISQVKTGKLVSSAAKPERAKAAK